MFCQSMQGGTIWYFLLRLSKAWFRWFDASLSIMWSFGGAWHWRRHPLCLWYFCNIYCCSCLDQICENSVAIVILAIKEILIPSWWFDWIAPTEVRICCCFLFGANDKETGIWCALLVSTENQSEIVHWVLLFVVGCRRQVLFILFYVSLNRWSGCWKVLSDKLWGQSWPSLIMYNLRAAVKLEGTGLKAAPCNWTESSSIQQRTKSICA